MVKMKMFARICYPVWFSSFQLWLHDRRLELQLSTGIFQFLGRTWWPPPRLSLCCLLTLFHTCGRDFVAPRHVHLEKPNQPRGAWLPTLPAPHPSLSSLLSSPISSIHMTTAGMNDLGSLAMFSQEDSSLAAASPESETSHICNTAWCLSTTPVWSSRLPALYCFAHFYHLPPSSAFFIVGLGNTFWLFHEELIQYSHLLVLAHHLCQPLALERMRRQSNVSCKSFSKTYQIPSNVSWRGD